MVDVKISALGAIASVAGEDLVAIVDDPSGTPASRKATIDQIKTYIGGITASSTDTLTNKTFDADGTGNSITNIENADIKAGAAIAQSKLALDITNSEINASAAIAYSKLNLSNSIVSGDIVDGTIALGDIATAAKTECIAIAASDETTALTTGTAKATFRMPYAFTLTDIRASLTTAPTTSGLFTVDVNDGGTSIMSTNKLTIDLTEKTTETAATAPVLTDTALANDAEITVDIDAISGGATETGLKVYLIGYQT